VLEESKTPKAAGARFPDSDNLESDLTEDIPKMNPNPDNDLAFFKFVIDSVPMAVVTMDAQLRITALNRWAEGITGYPSEQAVGRNCGEILRSGLCDSHCPLKAILSRAKSTVSARTTIHNRAGEMVPVRFSAAALFNDEGNMIGGVEAFMDISKLVAMERERDNLTSMLAHDMRSSLTGIHGLGLRLLRKFNGLDRDSERKHIEIITREAAKLESLIDDFIELSRIETGRLKLDLRATSLNKELEELFEIYRIKAAQHGVRLELHVDDLLPVVEADTKQLRRVFTNLLDNAIKFSNENGKVTISTLEKDKEVVVMVADEGIGIDPEDLPHIFDVFHRGRSVAGREGHGLGLATVKAIVEGHGGRVLVSGAANAGATFTVFLPKGESDVSHSAACFSSSNNEED
jgi:PAS domain S-box-containing protein